MAKERAPAFQFYPADFLGDGNVAVMSDEDVGRYVKLMCYCWIDGSIPADDALIASMLRTNEGWLKGGWVLVRRCFAKHPENPDRLVHPRLEKERQKQENWRDKSRKGGMQSGVSRRHTKGGSTKPRTKHEPKGNSSSSSDKDEDANASSYVRLVFDYWQQVSGHGRATLTDDRRDKIRTRLKTFNTDQLKRAIDGACANPFIKGKNDAGQRYDWPETIFKNDAAVERHMEYKPVSGAPQTYDYPEPTTGEVKWVT